ncbi:hypothetical protein [Frankia sp. R82]|uniref:hypothetical protein n=1 Tax=Frankia sp. R82 TaxID=2950553 RepID=UPI0020434DA6|nr:hypothetical protein [Frankia sp. R82]MCM3884114.1 hypothetical protein [Frankia sp. R82]
MSEQATFQVAVRDVQVHPRRGRPTPGDLIVMSAVALHRPGRLRRRVVGTGQIGYGQVTAVDRTTITCTGVRLQVQPGMSEFIDTIPARWFLDAPRFLAEAMARTWTVEDLDEGAPLNLLLHRHVLPEHAAEVIPE